MNVKIENNLLLKKRKSFIFVKVVIVFLLFGITIFCTSCSENENLDLCKNTWYNNYGTLCFLENGQGVYQKYLYEIYPHGDEPQISTIVYNFEWELIENSTLIIDGTSYEYDENWSLDSSTGILKIDNTQFSSEKTSAQEIVENGGNEENSEPEFVLDEEMLSLPVVKSLCSLQWCGDDGEYIFNSDCTGKYIGTYEVFENGSYRDETYVSAFEWTLTEDYTLIIDNRYYPWLASDESVDEDTYYSSWYWEEPYLRIGEYEFYPKG